MYFCTPPPQHSRSLKVFAPESKRSAPGTYASTKICSVNIININFTSSAFTYFPNLLHHRIEGKATANLICHANGTFITTFKT
jgi:hypothetical protein